MDEGTVKRRASGSASREALIAAAIDEFSRNGLSGARVDEIAARAGVNKQLVYHHFGSKEKLYSVALEAVYAEIRLKEQKLHLAELEPVAAMARLIEFSFDYVSAHPEFIALLTDENRYEAAHIKNSERLKDMHSPFIALLDATLKRGMRDKVFRSGVDAVQLYISIAGLSYFFFSNNYTLSAIFDERLGTKTALARRRKHVVEFALMALRPDAAD